ncbi:putative mycothiol system anti-sigma-R factor [Aeromicrobium marinum DSM 15272]|uniref:Regulator of SigK n=1 Tax=Aeromicrobium marinum DSM 15272 TaxID=585531 RepID=E2S9R9_9ACTN|nr:anti-sigma factor [Aeromicrobium marinum]EFQ83993.1 putative mycothiol system anti-sigma-R factor [Aeromicrobium marinum DSM 15272]
MSADIHALLAPYALDALDADERARFESHLDGCPSCLDELGGFLETAVRLADSSPVSAPDALRERLLTQIAATPQERPTVVGLRSRRVPAFLPRLAVAAALLVAAGTGTAYVMEHEEVVEIRAEQSRYEQIMTAQDSAETVARLDDGTSVRMIHSTRADAALLVVKDLPTIEDGSYQLWALKGNTAVSQGVFDDSSVLLVEDIGDADRVAITVEPRGGSDRPTTAPIASMDV